MLSSYVLLDNTDIELNSRDNDGETAFMLACRFGQKDVVQLLLDNGDRDIELNAKDYGGNTAFQIACFEGHKDVVELLLNYPEHIDIDVSEWILISEEIKYLIEMHFSILTMDLFTMSQ